MRSGRLPGDLSANAMTRARAALRARGIDVLDLTESNPTRVGLRYPDDLLAPLGAAAGLHYEPQPFGMRSAREAVAADFARRGLDVAPGRIVLTASTSEAYAWLFKLFCDPGDHVLVPRPSYPLFEHLTVLESVEARAYRLEYHGQWRIDLDHLRDALTPQTRALLVVSPNNPTGSVIHAADLTELAALCAERGLALIGDEVFADYLFGHAGGISVLQAREAVVCSLGGLSKSVGLPQVKLGWIAWEGPTERVEELMSACELIADTYLSVSTPAQIALPGLLARGASVRAQLQERIARNHAALRDAVARTPEVTLLQSDGGWSAVLRVPAYCSEERLVLELLTEDHVLVHPGFFFEFEREAFLVVSLILSPDEFDRGIARVLARSARRGARS